MPDGRTFSKAAKHRKEEREQLFVPVQGYKCGGEGSMDALEQRLDALDYAVFGNEPAGDVAPIYQRLSALTTKLAEHEKAFPLVQVCDDQLQKLGPLLSAHRGSLKDLVDRINLLVNERSDIESKIRQLSEISELSKFVNTDAIIAGLSERVRNVNAILLPLVAAAEKQTQELDDFLNVYHHTMNRIGDKFVEWDRRISKLEKKQSC